MARLEFTVRPAVSTDLGFVAGAWVDTYRGSSSWTRKVNAALFNRHAYFTIGAILKQAEVRIAAPPDDEQTVYGFAVLEPGMVHLVYTRKPMRKMGIATALLNGVDLAKCKYTTLSQDVSTWIRARFPMQYQPFYIQEPEVLLSAGDPKWAKQT